MSEQSIKSKADLSDFFADILNRGFSLRVKVTGRSMQPFLRGGEIVTIKKVPCSELRIGDLIFFDNSVGSPVLHRIVRKKMRDEDDLTFQTRGDALRTYDGPVRHDEILGKVCKIERVHPESGTGHIDMESPAQRMINYLMAVVNIIESEYYYAFLRRLKRLLIRP